MRKYVKSLIVSVVMVTFAFASTVMSSAESNGKVIYSNDFSGGGPDSTMTYLQSGKTETIKEKGESFLRCEMKDDGNTFRLNFGPEEAKNVDISFRIRCVKIAATSSARFGLYFRSPTIPAHESYAYQLRLSAAKTGIAFCDNFGDVTSTVLAENIEVGYDVGLWYNVKVALRETRIVVFVNGSKALDCTDDGYPALGGFGFGSYRADFDVDDIVMTAYTGKSLPEPVPNEAPIWAGDSLNDESEDFADSGEARLNILSVGGEKGGGTEKISIVDPDELTVNSYIAIGLIVALLIMAVSTFLVSYNLIKVIKMSKNEPQNIKSDKSADVSEEDENNEKIG